MINLAEIWQISNLNYKIWYDYDLSKKKASSYEDLPISGQAFLNKSVTMATLLVTVHWKLFQMMSYI